MCAKSSSSETKFERLGSFFLFSSSCRPLVYYLSMEYISPPSEAMPVLAVAMSAERSHLVLQLEKKEETFGIETSGLAPFPVQKKFLRFSMRDRDECIVRIHACMRTKRRTLTSPRLRTSGVPSNFPTGAVWTSREICDHHARIPEPIRGMS